MLITFGTTTNFVISYDSTLTGIGGEPNGPALAQTAMDYCEYDLQRLSILFGGILPSAANLPININIVPGPGGAENNEVNIINAYVTGTDGTYNQFGVAPTVVAELAEIFMVIQSKGWNPVWSNGEGLSRISGQLLYPANAWLFSVADDWYYTGNFPDLPTTLDWVDNTEPTDQDGVSYGCASLFLNYLAYQLNYKWTDIIAAVSPAPNSNLANTAGILGVSAPVYSNFLALLNTYYPGAVGFPNPSPTQTDDVFPLGAISSVPALYMRHNLADTGTSHAPPISHSPDIIVRNSQVAHPQAKYSTPASIAHGNLSENAHTGQANYVYLRVWNGAAADAANVFATVYWSPSATLVTPDLWNLIGTAYYPNVPAGSKVEVSNPGIVWPADQVPAPGHYCFVATVGNNNQPAPSPSSFATFADFKSYILANNNITWRNFNVVNPPVIHVVKPSWGRYIGLPFLMTGAWDQDVKFTFETEAHLPDGSSMALQVAEDIGKSFSTIPTILETVVDTDTDPKNIKRARIPLHTDRPHLLGDITLNRASALPSHLLVDIPSHLHDKPYEVSVRQLHEGDEVGRVTWLMMPPEEKQ